jgi:hypothetical protein
MASIISAVRTYLAAYSGLTVGAPLWVSYLGPQPTEYAIIPLAGTKIVEWYLDDGSLREFPFAFRSMESTADDLERMETNGFYEALSDWFESQTLAGDFPVLGPKQEPIRIETTGWAYLYEQGESSTGVYQVQCKLTYSQQP